MVWFRQFLFFSLLPLPRFDGKNPKQNVWGGRTGRMGTRGSADKKINVKKKKRKKIKIKREKSGRKKKGWRGEKKREKERKEKKKNTHFVPTRQNQTLRGEEDFTTLSIFTNKKKNKNARILPAPSPQSSQRFACIANDSTQEALPLFSLWRRRSYRDQCENLPPFDKSIDTTVAFFYILTIFCFFCFCPVRETPFLTTKNTRKKKLIRVEKGMPSLQK